MPISAAAAPHDRGPDPSLPSSAARHDVPRCLVCAAPLARPLRQCPRCRTLFHSECWQYQGGCAVYGCSGHGATPRAAADAPAGTCRAPARPPRRWQRDSGYAILLRISIGLAVLGGLAWWPSPLRGFPESLAQAKWFRESVLFLVIAMVIHLALVLSKPRSRKIWWLATALAVAVLLPGRLRFGTHGWHYRPCTNQVHSLKNNLFSYAHKNDGWYPRGDVHGSEALRLWSKDPDWWWAPIDAWAHHGLKLPGFSSVRPDFSAHACFFTYIPGQNYADCSDSRQLVLGYWPDFTSGDYCVLYNSSWTLRWGVSAQELSESLAETRLCFDRTKRPYDSASFVLRTDYR